MAGLERGGDRKGGNTDRWSFQLEQRCCNRNSSEGEDSEEMKERPGRSYTPNLGGPCRGGKAQKSLILLPIRVLNVY